MKFSAGSLLSMTRSTDTAENWNNPERMAMKGYFILTMMICASVCAAQTPDWTGIETLFNRKGTTSGILLKIAFPRSDLNVSVGDLVLAPELALTSWMAFE